MGGSVHDNALALHVCGKMLVNRCLHGVDSHLGQVSDGGGDRRYSIDVHMRVMGPEGFIKHGEVGVDKDCPVEKTVGESFTNRGSRDLVRAAVVPEKK
ncbi:hypothetical protein CJ202_02330 [Corynebacterium parakroppenstedtii]|nr:hypothetical protein CJ202_02330 [Corynebacterium kroppenstedtii]